MPTRIDSSHTHGWQARVYRNKHAISRMWSDSLCDGRECAFFLAVLWECHVGRLIPPTTKRIWMTTKKSVRNKSGQVGVHRSEIMRVEDGNKRLRAFWTATWVHHDRCDDSTDHRYCHKRKSFSVIKYCEREANRLAHSLASCKRDPIASS